MRRHGPLLHRDRIAALVEHQRRALEGLEAQHLADEDLVVAAFVPKGRAAAKARRAAGQQRHPALAACQIDAGELVGAALREQVRHRLLIGREASHPGPCTSRTAKLAIPAPY